MGVLTSRRFAVQAALPLASCGLAFFIAESAMAGLDGFEDDSQAPPTETGVELSAGIGYATVSGRYAEDKRLLSRIVSGLPIRVGLGYRPQPPWFIGGYAEYSPLQPSLEMKRRCKECVHNWLHFGLEGQYRFYETKTNKLWVSLGIGRHSFSNELNKLTKRSRVATGPDISLSLGSEWHTGWGIAIGPASTLSIGTFSELVDKCDVADACETEKSEAEAPGAHLFFSTGLRFTFLP